MIREGDTFTRKVKDGRHEVTHAYRREADDSSPMFPCERMRVTHLSTSNVPPFTPYTFGAEAEWWTQRGLAVGDR